MDMQLSVEEHVYFTDLEKRLLEDVALQYIRESGVNRDSPLDRERFTGWLRERDSYLLPFDISIWGLVVTNWPE